MTILILLSAAWLFADADQPDAKMIQGVWRVTEATRAGQPDAAELGAKYTFDLKTMRFERATGNVSNTGEFGYKLDAGRKPKIIELETGKRWLYQLDGDTLRVCFSLQGDAPPAEFPPKPDPLLAVRVLKRQKP